MNRVKVKNATAVTGMLFIKPYDFLSNVMSVIHVLGTLNPLNNLIIKHYIYEKESLYTVLKCSC